MQLYQGTFFCENQAEEQIILNDTRACKVQYIIIFIFNPHHDCAVDVIFLNLNTFQTYIITRVHCAELIKNCQSMTMQFVIKQLRAHIASALK